MQDLSLLFPKKWKFAFWDASSLKSTNKTFFRNKYLFGIIKQCIHLLYSYHFPIYNYKICMNLIVLAVAIQSIMKA